MIYETTSERFTREIMEPGNVQSEALRKMACDIINVCNSHCKDNENDFTVQMSAAIVKILLPGAVLCFRGGDEMIEATIAQAFSIRLQNFVEAHIVATSKMRKILGNDGNDISALFKEMLKRTQ